MPAWAAFWRAPVALGDRLCAALLDPRRRERHAVLVRVRDDLDEIAKVEQMPRMEGRQMTMVVSPK